MTATKRKPPAKLSAADLPIVPEPESAALIKAQTASERMKGYVDNLQDEALTKLCSGPEIQSAMLRSRNPKMRELLAGLVSPRNASKSIARIARDNDVHFMDVMDMLRADAMERGTGAIVTAWPDLAADIVQDSKTQTGNCAECNGTGKIQLPALTGKKSSIRACRRCKGTGEITIPGNTEARKLALQAIGVIKSGSGPSININNVNTAQHNYSGPECVIDAIEKLDKSAHDSIMEAEFVDVGPGGDELGEIPLE